MSHESDVDRVTENADDLELPENALQADPERIEQLSDTQYKSELEVAYGQLYQFVEELRATIDARDAAYIALEKAQRSTLMRLTLAAEIRDGETGSHIARVSHYATLVARTMGLDETYVELLRLATPMHDVGKIGVPDHVLKKPGKLNRDEWVIMRLHTEYGAQILGDSDTPMLQLASEIALGHHEKWDGSGYPLAKAGEDIPLSCRIVAIADVFDAMTSDRVYRKAIPEDDVLNMIKQDRGTHFDPDVHDAFFAVTEEVRLARRRFQAHDPSKSGIFNMSDFDLDDYDQIVGKPAA